MALAALHPSNETLVAYGLGNIEDSAADEVMRHLEICDACKRRVANLPADSFVSRLRDAVGAKADTSRPDESLPDGPGERPARAPAALPPELAQATQYADIRELGRGGMGVVYLARNTIMDRLEVLKVVNRSADRFLREIQAAARLKHPNVVGAYSAQRLGNLLVFAMEFVPGEDLAQLVKARGPLPIPQACNYAYQAALGLQHAYEQEMVHRDIKPSNLILTHEGKKPVVKILDFGLAKGTSETAIDASLTAEGAMLGTPDYIAPEQTLDAAKADIRSDIYSLGCTLYHLLSGRPPFAGRSIYEILRAHHSTEATRLGAIRPEVPDELAAVVAKMMAKEPARRFATPAAVAAALSPFFKPVAKETAKSIPAVKPAMGRLEPVPAPKLPPPLPVVPAEPEPQPPPTPLVVAPQSTRPKRRVRFAGGVVAGILLFAFSIAWATGALRVKTPEGTIVLEGLPADADVLVNGEIVTVSRNGDAAIVTLQTAGRYGLKVRLGDRDIFSDDVTVKLDGKPVRVTVEDRVQRPDPKKIPPADVPGSPKPAGTDSPKPSKLDRTARSNAAGNWRIDGDNVIHTDAVAENSLFVFGDPDWIDYEFSFEAIKTEGDFGVAALFRARDLKNYMVFDLAGWQNRKLTVECFVDGKHNWVTLDKFGSMAKNRKYQVEVRARGDHFVCSVDGAVVYDFRDDRHARGAVGFRCWGGAVRVGSIQVKSPDGTVLWRGPPELSPVVGKANQIDPKVRAAYTNRGDWSIDGTELVQSDNRAGDCQLAFGDLTWTDYNFLCEAKQLAGRGEIGQTFRVNNAGRYEWIMGRWTFDCDSVGSVTDGGLERLKWRKSGKLEVDRWYRIEVRVRGTSGECFIDGESIFKFEHARHKDGQVGLRTFRTQARFRNMMVTDPAGKVLFEGLPKLPATTVDWLPDS